MKRKPPHSAVLAELAAFAIESDTIGLKFDYSEDDFINALIVFNSISGSILFDLGVKEKVSEEILLNQAESFGNELRLLIYTYLDIDTHKK